jgi:UDP-N-acetylmuramoyl-L-alanyl-D-glutamate--2,6-diaminopimelate ligase
MRPASRRCYPARMSTARPVTLAQLLAGAPHLEYRGCGADTLVPALVVDSRRVTPGAVFLALTGATHDGHAYIPQAIAAGAAVIIGERARIAELDHPHVLLEDSAAAYPRIAAAFYGAPGEHLRAAGVTGTNGKTTTTYLVAAMLAAAGRRHIRLGTVDNWLVDRAEPAAYTTPFPIDLQAQLAAARARGGTDLIMEVSSHALAQGRIRPLSFDAVGMTSFSQDHLDFHGTMERYLEAKRQLAREHLRPGGVAVAAVDDHPACRDFLAAAPDGSRRWRASRGADPDAELYVVRRLEAAQGLAAELRTPAGEGLLCSPLVAEYNLDNLLVAIGIGIGLGVDLQTILGALQGCHGAPGRLQRVALPGAEGPAVYIDYAHTPEAVERVLAALRPRTRGALTIVLGCGGDRDRAKRPMMGRLAAAADRFIATSDNPRTEDPQQILDQMLAGVEAADRPKVAAILDRRAAILAAIAEASADDTVVIAGKGHETYQIHGHTPHPFDDAHEALAALRRRAGAALT